MFVATAIACRENFWLLASRKTSRRLLRLPIRCVPHEMAWALRSPPFLPIQGNCPSSHLVFLLLRANLLSSFRHRDPVTPLSLSPHLDQSSGLCKRRVFSKIDHTQSRIDPGEARLDQLVASRSQLAVLRIGLAHRADHNQDGLKVL